MRFEIPVLLTSVLKKAITVTPKASVIAARDILLRYGVKRLVVVKGINKPVGIITEKDLTRVVSVFSRRDIWDMKVDDLMSKKLVTVKKDHSVYICAKLMKNYKISSVIVLNDDETLAGIITKTDLVGAFLMYNTTGPEISKYMTRKVITVDPKESLFVVQSVLVNNKISRVVVEKNKKPVGIVTYRDFLPVKIPHWMQYHEIVDLEKMRKVTGSNKFDVNRPDYLLTSRAQEIMTPNPVVINKNDEIFNAALLMIRHRISGLPVIHNRVLMGIITKSDIVNAINDG